MIRVDNNIPIPELGRGNPQYPFGTMKLKGSFLYKKHLDDPVLAIRRISAIKSTWIKNKKSKRKFTCRRVKNGIRVWRIK